MTRSGSSGCHLFHFRGLRVGASAMGQTNVHLTARLASSRTYLTTPKHSELTPSATQRFENTKWARKKCIHSTLSCTIEKENVGDDVYDTGRNRQHVMILQPCVEASEDKLMRKLSKSSKKIHRVPRKLCAPVLWVTLMLVYLVSCVYIGEIHCKGVKLRHGGSDSKNVVSRLLRYSSKKSDLYASDDILLNSNYPVNNAMPKDLLRNTHDNSFHNDVLLSDSMQPTEHISRSGRLFSFVNDRTTEFKEKIWDEKSSSTKTKHGSKRNINSMYDLFDDHSNDYQAFHELSYENNRQGYFVGTTQISNEDVNNKDSTSTIHNVFDKTNNHKNSAESQRNVFIRNKLEDVADENTDDFAYGINFSQMLHAAAEETFDDLMSSSNKSHKSSIRWNASPTNLSNTGNGSSSSHFSPSPHPKIFKQNFKQTNNKKRNPKLALLLSKGMMIRKQKESSSPSSATFKSPKERHRVSKKSRQSIARRKRTESGDNSDPQITRRIPDATSVDAPQLIATVQEKGNLDYYQKITPESQMHAIGDKNEFVRLDENLHYDNDVNTYENIENMNKSSNRMNLLSHNYKSAMPSNLYNDSRLESRNSTGIKILHDEGRTKENNDSEYDFRDNNDNKNKSNLQEGKNDKIDQINSDNKSKTDAIGESSQHHSSMHSEYDLSTSSQNTKNLHKYFGTISQLVYKKDYFLNSYSNKDRSSKSKNAKIPRDHINPTRSPKSHVSADHAAELHNTDHHFPTLHISDHHLPKTHSNDLRSTLIHGDHHSLKDHHPSHPSEHRSHNPQSLEDDNEGYQSDQGRHIYNTPLTSRLELRNGLYHGLTVSVKERLSADHCRDVIEGLKVRPKQKYQHFLFEVQFNQEVSEK